MLLSIDPGKTIGYALFDNDGMVVEYGKKTDYDLEELYSMIRDNKADLAIETQFLKNNLHTFEKLVNLRTALEILTVIQGNVVYRVYPIQWQRWIGIKHKTKRSEVKRLAKEYVKNALGDIILTQDTVDAIVIGMYVFANYNRIPVLDKDNYFEDRR